MDNNAEFDVLMYLKRITKVVEEASSIESCSVTMLSKYDHRMMDITFKVSLLTKDDKRTGEVPPG